MRFNRVIPSVKKLYHACFPFLFLSLSVTLQCCGQGVTRSESNRLRVNLQVPEGDGHEFFWLGVSSRKLRWAPESGKVKESEWAEGSLLDWDAREGDRIAFEAADGSGRVVVQGEAPVTKEKIVTIPLRRVL